MTSPANFAIEKSTPQRVYTPRDAQELAQFLAQCNAEKCAVVPWGGGTLQHVGNAPARYDVALQTTNLNQVVEYAFDDLTATFAAGMTLAEIDRVLSEHGQFLPLDVPHPERATIGGVLASGMNGTLRLRYGPARDYMLGNRFANVDGQIIKAGSKVVKNVAGYELHKVQVGAFGTLGVITEATFKLFPKPPAEMTVLASFQELSDACEAVPQLWNLSTPPLALELLSGSTAQWIESNASGAWHIAARFGGSKATMASARDLCIATANEHQASSADEVTEAAKFWHDIANMPSTLREKFPDALLVRVSIPPQQLQAALRLILELDAAHQHTPPRIFAHAAVTSLYVSFDDNYASPEEFLAKLRAKLRDIHGHLVVESAVPSLKKNINVWDEVSASFKLMQSLKRKFDPNNILNPGRFVGGI